MDECQFQLAQKFCQRALEMDCDNLRALQLSASLLLEVGEVERAQQCLGRAIFLQPEEGHTKYLSLAQLLTGTEARDLYNKGAQLITAGLQREVSEMEGRELSRELSNTYVAISEIYMTDLCDSEEAETESRRYIQLAVEADRSNPEAQQALASYSLVTAQLEEARTAMDTSLQLWLPQHLLFLEKGEGEETSLSYTFRLSTAKLLLDLEDYNTASKVLESLAEEDDEVVATWYLLGWMNFLRSDPDYHGNVRYYLDRAKQVNTVNPTDDEAMLEHIDEILAEIGPQPDADDESEGSQLLPGATAAAAIVEQGDDEDAVADILDREAEEEHINNDDRMED